MKESFIKAIGTGLQTPLADFTFVDVDTDTPQIRWIRPGLDRGRQWRFRAIEPSPGYIAAVAVGMPGGSEGSLPESLRVESHSFDRWLRGYGPIE